ncbi:MAG TPA: type IV toxin-antitoxin system AbiEi family antitoxin domain-containing protein [Solirubrobacterales bacterium]|nr:type IV toxin-antitoxin system AbiEi family antitoxin domain-containing protein [Solirubrobacterales bacterium]
MRMKCASADELLAAVAGRQHGVVARRQLIAAGMTQSGVARRLAGGRLHQLHRGVYAVGHRAISRQGRWMAAVLAVGGGPSSAGEPLKRWGAAVSHRSAGELWSLVESREGPVEVTIPGDSGKRRRRGIWLHRSATLLPAHVTLRAGIPVTGTARTIRDLRRVVPARELRRALRQAEVIGLPLGEENGTDRTRSDLERDFLRLCRRHHLPRPEVNVMAGRDLVDFLWRDRRLIVETDGYRYHRGLLAFEEDRARDLRLRELGFQVIRVSEAMLDGEPERLAETLGRALRVGEDADDRKSQGQGRRG